MNSHPPKITVLVLGSTGMLGNAVLRYMAENTSFHVWGSARSRGGAERLQDSIRERIIFGVDIENIDSLCHLLNTVRPNVVINCIGLVKQLAEADDPLQALPINSILPHRLARLCSLIDARLVHVSTDCVFTGQKGQYKESDIPDAIDLYGRSKLLGEVDHTNAITLRTSIIGHELASSHGLIDWFLAQKGSILGFTHAAFSGLPTCELARVISEYVIPNPHLHGVYHVSADPITKYELLRLVSTIYDHGIEIILDDKLVIDRSLDSTRFRNATGYLPPSWPDLIQRMRSFG